MSYLLLYGVGGWSQRWQIPEGQDDLVHTEIARLGQEGIGRLSVIDSQTDAVATLVIAWQSVAAAVVIDSAGAGVGDSATGQYA
ncbi:hypothetical protein [Nocardioides iriomotensis]|uniref:Uncharacterized protein n=1 Tax=Nocardioides iriomotensis TaxID=715784 RepID=A0A4Q5J5L4_9ACTN|nr:hypothetical protein [Nocardioides iriomotensis]RYU13942.1 hypothetical protein ETU37_05325 [Nocardioides iriomotensis]